MEFHPAPYFLKPASVTRVMLTVGAALLPGLIAYVVFFGPGILRTLAIASVAALLFEAVMLQIRGKPLTVFLQDGSALLTAWLLALSLPPTAPWWLVVVGVFFAIVIAKHLYGGLGQNPFNPAMIGFAVCIVSFPALMGQWPGVDAITAATPLDHLKTALKLGEGQTSVAAITTDRSIYGLFAGHGWDWIAAGYLLGGGFLVWRKIITWHIPVAFLAAIGLFAGGLWLYDAHAFASPLFHLFGGATMLGAFFIATDPVSAATTPRGKLIFGFGCGLIAVIIRIFGGYPDGIAFAVLLMNLCVPIIDMATQPPVFGTKGSEGKSS
jgi:electron transport complex protein RnfD